MPALSTEDVLRDEAKAIHGVERGRALDGKAGPEFYQELYKLDSAALCLSGGGIRSAAFALGVIQALATHPRPSKDRIVDKAENSLLAKFHYLSTVSGGGYIGSWLSSWLVRRNPDGTASWGPIWQALIGQRLGSGQEPPELSWLRSYSNFLTPKLGVTSADSWAAVSLIARNLLLNWLVILPWLCAVLLAGDLLAIGFVWLATIGPESLLAVVAFGVLVGAGAIAQAYALRFLARNRPTSRNAGDVDQSGFLCHALVPLLLAALFFALVATLPNAQHVAKNYFSQDSWDPASFYTRLILIGIALYAVSWLAAWPARLFPEDTRKDFAAWLAGGAVYGGMIALGLNLFAYYVAGKGIWFFHPSEVLLLAAGPPWVLVSYLVADTIYVGLTSARPDSDSDREWLGRAAGWILAAALAWLVVTVLVFLGATIASDILDKYWPWLMGGGAGTGGMAAWLAKSAASPAVGEAKGIKAISVNVLLAIAAPVFAVLLVILTTAALDRALFESPLVESDLFKGNADGSSAIPAWPGGWWVPGALAVAVAIGSAASYFININRFSLHALYRNRLIRAFLGASNPARNPNRFTGFDENDNLRVYDLWPKDIAPNQWPAVTPANWRPFQVINIALNSVSTNNLAWQERKAEPFTVSALHSGSHCVGFRYSTYYGDRRGISLGTAMAISGAAASPNQGYHSSPALAFLMTLFNVRLGWWLGNPGPQGEETCKLEGPARAIVPLLYEMFGQTTDDWKYVYLSDGGHFENLGIYEMVRRRCRCIVVSDAGCDPKFELEDLGNAVRKIAIDLGVKIRFDGLQRLQTRHAGDSDLGVEAPYYAVGTVDYSSAHSTAEPGYILYIKPAFHGTENVDIRNYALAHHDFPHETTGDQFFSESQFESYRALGYEIADRVVWEALGRLKSDSAPTICNLIKALQAEA